MSLRTIRAVLGSLSIIGVFGCGGRETATDGVDRPDGALPEPPTCSAICAHVVGSCAPGANTSDCVTDCEASRAASTRCPIQLDIYLRCMGTVAVECSPGRAVIVGCSSERNALDRCV